MINKERRYFESRHVQELLGIDKDRIHHWTQNKRLIIPAVKAKGRGERSKFSFSNLVELSIVRELVYCGLELNIIKRIMIPVRKCPPWRDIKNRGAQFLVIIPTLHKQFNVHICTQGEWGLYPIPRSVILLDILIIIQELEEKTGITL